MQPILLAVLGAMAGMLSGFLGIGGAILVVPALVLLFKFDQLTAQGTSLAMLLPPIGFLAVARYWKAGHIDMKAALILAVTFFLFASLGAYFAIQLPQAIMKKVFGVSLVAIGIFMFFKGN